MIWDFMGRRPPSGRRVPLYNRVNFSAKSLIIDQTYQN